MDKDLDFGDEELVHVEGDDSHCKGAIISLLVIIGICSLIILSIIILTPSTNLNSIDTEPFEMNQILDQHFIPQLFNGTWISGHEFVFRDISGSIVLFDARTNNVTSIYVQSSITKQHSTEKFSVSADRRFVLLISDYRKMLNLVFTAKLIVYNITNENVIHLEDTVEKDAKVSIQLAEWGPVGNSLAFVSNNDLYYIPFVGGQVQRITSSGKEGVIFNGIVDFLYRETIFAKESMIWWSKDGSSICYATINNTLVDESTLIYYGNLNSGENDLPKIVTYKYPKAQQIIPKAELWVIHLNNSAPQRIEPPKQILNTDYYITYVNWISNHTITVIWTLRNQSLSIVSLCSRVDKWVCKQVITISSVSTLKKLAQSFLASDDGLTYFMISLRPDSLIGSYYHISTFNINERLIESFITFGGFDVTKLLHYDNGSQTLYFEASTSIISEKRHIYKVSTRHRHVQCITCNLTNINCHYFQAIFSLTAQFYVLQCLGPSIPKVFLLNTNDQNIDFVFEGNEQLQNKLNKKIQMSHQIFSIILENKKLHVKLLLPPQFDAEHKYSLVIEANNPEDRKISEKFDISWSEYLVSKHKYIYGWIEADPENWRHPKQTQNYDYINENIHDYGLAINYMKENMPFINKHQVCIWGSNIGAFIAISALAESEILECAILVSPVINWRLMDLVTSEHILNSLQTNDNYALLENINLMNKIDQLIRKPILFIHGSADEKVHIQHTMQLIKYFINIYMKNGWDIKEPLHQLQIYPDEDNSLYKVRHHMYETMQTFLDHIFNQNHKHGIKIKNNSAQS